jgi:peptidyl-prolyl cis-trans isomerase B (cyclophilin B)
VASKNERQRRQAREKHRRQQELRMARRQQLRKRWLIGGSAVLAAALVASLLVVFLTGGGTKKAAASASKSPSASASASPSATATATAAVAEPAHHCSYTSATPAAKKVSLPPATPDFAAGYQATINTNLGKITFSLLNSKATCTVNSFVHLAQAGYFDKTQCHRVVNSGIYVLQCGDPYATATTKLTCSATSKIGTGSPGYDFANENLTGAKYPAGTVAMANSGANTNGSQFFIVYKDSSTGLTPAGQTPAYTPFATVSSGLGIVQNVAKDGYSCQYVDPSSGQAEGGAPKEKVIIDSVTVKKA